MANIVDGSPACSNFELKPNENTSTQLFTVSTSTKKSLPKFDFFFFWAA